MTELSQAPVQSVSRDELYRAIWTTPCSRLAHRYGVSDVGLAKACTRHNIPRPPRGYWAKLKHGKKVRQTALPANSDPDLETVYFDMAGFGSVRQPIDDPEVGKVANKRRAEQQAIQVPDRLASPHQLVAVTKEYLAKQEPDTDGILDGTSEATLSVRVGRRSVGRALRIFDALLKHWERLGGEVRNGVDHFDRTRVTWFAVAHVEVAVSMNEKTERIDTGDGNRYSRWNARWRPNGRLVLSVNRSSGDGIRSTWADGKRQRLENVLDSFVEGLLRHVENRRQQQRDRDIEGRQEARMQERRERRKRVAEEEEERRSPSGFGRSSRRFRRWSVLAGPWRRTSAPAAAGGLGQSGSRIRWTR
jgi:hypothetical protein